MEERAWRRALAGIVLVFVGVYAQALGHGFVWDDFATVVENPFYAAPLAESLRATQHDQLDPTLIGTGLPLAYESYRPLLFLSYALDDRLFARAAPAMHAHNLVLALVALLAAAWLARQLLADRAAALAVAALFALHPIQVEAACYVSARGDLLAGALALLASGAFVAGLDAERHGRRAAWALTAAAAYVASLAAKESAASLPLALALLAALRGRLRAATLPLAALGSGLVAYAALRVALVGAELSAVDPQVSRAALWHGPAYALQGLLSFALPTDLSIERLAWRGAGSVAAGWIFWAAAAATALGALRRGTPGAVPIAGGLAWFALLLAPSAVAVETMGVLADRYLAIALFGAALATVAALQAAAGALAESGALLRWAAAGWAVACLGVTALQIGVWRDNDALYAHSLLVEPGSAMAHYRVGVLAARRQGWPEALEHFERAVALDAENLSALNNLGVAYLNLGRLEEADAALRRVLALSGDRNFRAWNNLANVHFARARTGEGCAALQRSLAINPAYDFARRNHAHHCLAAPGAHHG